MWDILLQNWIFNFSISGFFCMITVSSYICKKGIPSIKVWSVHLTMRGMDQRFWYTTWLWLKTGKIYYGRKVHRLTKILWQKEVYFSTYSHLWSPHFFHQCGSAWIQLINSKYNIIIWTFQPTLITHTLSLSLSLSHTLFILHRLSWVI